MALGKKGQAALVGLMTAFVVIIFAFQLITPIKDEVVTARSSDNLNYTSPDISTGTKMTCIATDLYLPYFVIAALACAGAYLIGRKIYYQYSPPQQ